MGYMLKPTNLLSIELFAYTSNPDWGGRIPRRYLISSIRSFAGYNLTNLSAKLLSFNKIYAFFAE